MVDFEFLIRKHEETHMHSDIELFYVMEGIVDFSLEDKEYHMQKDDFLVVNVDKKHSFLAQGDFLGISLHISYSDLCKMLKQNLVFFWCNTVVDQNEIIQELRCIIKKIIGEQYINKGKDVIYMQSLYYEFLHVLTHDFLLNENDQQYSEEEHKFDERKHMIVEYIRMNYDKQISLNDLANKLYLSNAYLSKYIKRQFGMSFIDYVNSVRLNYALSQLIHSDKSIVRIAMDTGFASSAALNKAFKEKYSMTPSVYRSQWKDKEIKNINTIEDEEAIQKRLYNFFTKAPVQTVNDKNLDSEVVTFMRDEKTILNKHWNKMINIGAAADLLHSDMQNHLLYLKKQLQFEYVRFWDLYAPEMFLNVYEKKYEYNFGKIDQVLDFIVKNKLKPYIELCVKPKKIISNPRKMVLLQERDSFMENLKYAEDFFRKLIVHLINRYTASKLETWYFEIWKKEEEEHLTLSEVKLSEESVEIYLNVFDVLAGIIREYLPNASIGGGGFSLRYGENHFRSILRNWKKRKELPNFVSMYNYPYTVDCMGKRKNQTMDTNFIKTHVESMKKIMAEEDFHSEEFHISEWSFSVSNRNVLNDHCMKGAYLVKNMIDTIGLADVMGYWLGTDLYADYYDSRYLLSGSGGLLTKDGIPKPAYYAFDFMNRLGKYLRKKDRNYIITDNGQGNWRIICHNLKKLSYQYGLMEEDEVLMTERDNLFENQRKKQLTFELPAMRDGNYFIRSYTVNSKWGSIQNIWEEMIGPVELNPEDMEYIGRITIPRMTINQCETHNGMLRFDVVMEPNEIQFIHVSYQL